MCLQLPVTVDLTPTLLGIWGGILFYLDPHTSSPTNPSGVKMAGDGPSSPAKRALELIRT